MKLSIHIYSNSEVIMSIKIGSSQELNVTVEKVTSFFEKNWDRKIALSSIDFYNWQFINTPFNLGDQCCVVLQNNEIIAVMGLNERGFLFENHSLSGAELTTWIVREDKRRLGLGPKMIDYLQSKYLVLFGMGISDQALPVYLRKNFKYIKSIPRFVRVLNENAVKTFGVHTPLLAKLNRKEIHDDVFYLSSPTKDIANRIFQKFATENNLFNRNSEWLSWRYNEHPSFNYVQKVITNDENNKCIVVYRLDRLKNLTIMHCVDLFGELNAFPSALSFLDREAINEKVDIIDFYSTNSKVNAHFVNKNWFSILDCDFLDFPHLFHPIEMRTPSTTSLIMWCKNQEASFYDIGNLYITKQDCDFDRPTNIIIQGAIHE